MEKKPKRPTSSTGLRLIPSRRIRNNPVEKPSAYGKGTKLLFSALVVGILIVIALAIIIVVVMIQSSGLMNFPKPGGTRHRPRTAGGADCPEAGVQTTRPTTAAPEKQKDDICLTKDCVRASLNLIEAMNTSVDPCEDFYTFACGGWIKNNPIPDGEDVHIPAFKMLSELKFQLKVLLEEPNKPTDPRAVMGVKNHYKACMDDEAKEARGLTPLFNFYKEFGSWPMIDSSWNENSFDIVDAMIKQDLNGHSSLISFFVHADLVNISFNILMVDQPKLGLAYRDYYLQDKFAYLLEGYKAFITETALYLNGSESTVHQDVKDLIEFETAIANFSSPSTERISYSQLYNLFKVSELYSNITSEFDWLGYLNGLFASVEYQFTNSSELVIYEPTYLKKMLEKLQKTPKRVIANHLSWHITKNVIGDLPKALQNISRKFDQIRTGKQSPPKKQESWEQCAESANSFEYATGRLHTDKYFNAEAKATLLKMAHTLKDSFREMLDSVDWMSKETKAYAKSKLAMMSLNLGYPEWTKDDMKLNEYYKEITGELYPGKWFESNGALRRHNVMKQIREGYKLIERENVAKKPVNVGGYYYPNSNAIVFPAGQLQPPFWSPNRPESLNYGSSGHGFGHEMTHGFDNRGRMYNNVGEKGDWWTEDEVKSFYELSQCFIDEYGSYIVPQVNKSIDATRSLPELIADNGGLKHTFRAYLAYEKKHGVGQRLPGLIDLSSKQLFFLASAQVFCESWEDARLDKLIRYSGHPPGVLRVRGMLSNSPEFAEAYQCPVGSIMNPVKKCSVW